MLLNLKPMKECEGLYQIQAIASFTIILFHIWPNIYPNGYFGLDIFFVTAGYSMAYNKINTLPDVKRFYLHQIRKIIPLYSLTIFINLLYNGWLYEAGHYFRIVYDALWSLSFTKYEQIIKYGFQPFNLLNENGSLLHGWFLGAQFKFCIYAPLVSHFCHGSRRSLLLLIIIAIDSFLMYSTNPTDISTLVTFFPRLWQYLIGVIGFLLDDVLDDSIFKLKALSKFKFINNNLVKLYIANMSLLLFCLFNPFSSNLYSVTYRVIVSFAAIFAIKLKQQQKSLPTIIKYIGETSFVLYLIHPLLVSYSLLWGLTNITGFKVIIFIGSLIFPVLVQELFQVPMKKFSMLNIPVLVFVGAANQLKYYTQGSLTCYCKIYGYKFIQIVFDRSPEMQALCPQKHIQFQKICVLLKTMQLNPDIKYLYFTSADIGVINPNHRMEDYINPKFHIAFSERIINYDIMSDSFIVKNTEFSIKFIQEWLDLEKSFTVAYGSNDQAAIHQMLLNRYYSNHSKKEKCDKIWASADNNTLEGHTGHVCTWQILWNNLK